MQVTANCVEMKRMRDFKPRNNMEMDATTIDSIGEGVRRETRLGKVNSLMIRTAAGQCTPREPQTSCDTLLLT